MPNSFLAPGVICPYYRYDLNNQIVCESPADAPALSTATNFGSARDAREYILEFCSTRCYQGCPLYQAIQKKYEDP